MGLQTLYSLLKLTINPLLKRQRKTLLKLDLDYSNDPTNSR
jgi:hypothetical protein